MKQGGSQSSNYSPLIAKAVVNGNASALADNKAGTKTKEEYHSQFKTSKPEKPIDWASDYKKKEKDKIKFINETKKDQIQEITYVTKC